MNVLRASLSVILQLAASTGKAPMTAFVAWTTTVMAKPVMVCVFKHCSLLYLNVADWATKCLSGFILCFSWNKWHEKVFLLFTLLRRPLLHLWSHCKSFVFEDLSINSFNIVRHDLIIEQLYKEARIRTTLNHQQYHHTFIATTPDKRPYKQFRLITIHSHGRVQKSHSWNKKTCWAVSLHDQNSGFYFWYHAQNSPPRSLKVFISLYLC